MRRPALIAACLATWLAPQAAAAATATLEYEEPIPGLEPEPAYTLSVRGAAGEENRLTVSGDAAGYTVRDLGAPLAPGEGCDAVSAAEVHCPTPEAASSRTVFVDGGDRPDRLTVGQLAVPGIVELRGGGDDDLILGGAGRDLLLGGSGDDVIAGGADRDEIDGGSGDDRIDGGVGVDLISYETRRVPVRVDLGEATGGRSGERDELVGVEAVIGGLAADVLTGDAGPNTLVGGRGDAPDTLIGRAGDDRLLGYRVDGGKGSDGLEGHVVSCGAGDDIVYRFLYSIRGPFPRSCERVAAIWVVLPPDPVASSGRHAVFEISCRFAGLSCSGTLELRDKRGRLGFARFSLDDTPGKTARVRIPLARRPGHRTATLRLTFKQAAQRDHFLTRLH